VVTSERKKESNRINAQKSTGATSAAGKRRSSRNAQSHGLSAQGSYAGYSSADVSQLVEKMVGPDSNAFVKAVARDAAHAQLRLETIVRYQVSLIERARVFGTLDPVPNPPLLSAQATLINLRVWAWTGLFPRPPDPEKTMPQDEPARTDEAIRRALPRLSALNRYERRELNARSRGLKAMSRAIAMTRPNDEELTDAKDVSDDL
jgi:hypothetical protein